MKRITNRFAHVQFVDTVSLSVMKIVITVITVNELVMNSCIKELLE